MATAYLYILRCADSSYYVGTARTTLEVRVAQHNDGTYGGYTSMRRPVALVFHQEFANITDAIAAERQVKGWSRAKKEALIRGDFAALRDLARGWTKGRASFDCSPDPVDRAPRSG
jgi:predicted GIY-YIG superfamily endonuclease